MSSTRAGYSDITVSVITDMHPFVNVYGRGRLGITLYVF